MANAIENNLVEVPAAPEVSWEVGSMIKGQGSDSSVAAEDLVEVPVAPEVSLEAGSMIKGQGSDSSVSPPPEDR